MTLSGKFLTCFTFALICFSVFLLGSGPMALNEALAADFTKDSPQNLIKFQLPGDRTPISNTILAQADKTDRDFKTKDDPSEKIPSALTVAYSVWYSEMTLSVEGDKGTTSLGLHGPSMSYSFDKWSLSGSFLMPMTKGTLEANTYGTAGGTTDGYMYSELDRYDADIILRRSFGAGNWIFGPQFGIKYMGIKNYNSTVKLTKISDGSNTTYRGEGDLDAYGPSLGGVIAYIPGNPETSPITFSLIANVLYLRLTGKDPNAPLYSQPKRLSDAGYNPNGTYYGLDYGSVALHEIDTWIPGYNASFQMTYNMSPGFNATVGGRYNYAKNKEFYNQSGLPGDPNYSAQSLVWLEYWGAFANVAYTW